MLPVIQITNPYNKCILRCKFTTQNIFLGLIDGKKMMGVAVPIKSFLESSPATDMFINNVFNKGFYQEHLDLLYNSAGKYYIKK